MQFGSPHRSRLIRRARGVSPIIATILLVAITVVLAAVLYVLVSGLSHGTTSVPLGSELVAGPATPAVGTAATNAFCESGHYCYSVAVDEAGHGIPIDNLAFRVLESTGAVHVVSKNYAMISIVNEKNAVLAYSQVKKNTGFTVSDWEKYESGASGTTSLTSLEVIWIQFGNTASSPFGTGMTLEILGTGSYSGSVNVALP
ncbi:MAG TPA: archaellin/type IV pilin N-terminal domain-containing protein [Thermoplasmata archaeon]|nr:archaellin/type IV pilin N-terminal domain-containing protein [Thermoplasmata archaeon]